MSTCGTALDSANLAYLTQSAGFWRRRANFGDMPHLAAGARRALAIEMHSGAGNRQPLLVVVDIVPDQIGHRDRGVADRFAERPAGNGPYVLLELRDGGAVQRPVPGIMHPRRDLVDQHRRAALLLHHEHFDREHADIIERGRDLLGNGAGFFRKRRRYVGRRARDFQDVVAVLVFGDVERLHMAVRRARRDHGDFTLERNERLEDRGFGAEVFPDLLDVVAIADDRLALAVIAEATRLDDCGQADAGDRGAQGFHGRYVGVIGGADAELLYKILFDQPVLRRLEDFLRGDH